MNHSTSGEAFPPGDCSIVDSLPSTTDGVSLGSAEEPYTRYTRFQDSLPLAINGKKSRLQGLA